MLNVSTERKSSCYAALILVMDTMCLMFSPVTALTGLSYSRHSQQVAVARDRPWLR